MRALTEVKMSIQRMVCTQCGAEANASCNCGVAYQPKAVRAREAIKANPEKSDRAIAKEIGVSDKTVAKAREATADFSAVENRIGLDGKVRRLPNKSRNLKAREVRDTKIGLANARSVFLMNCAASVQVAHFKGPIDAKIRAAARRVADVWTKLADDMEKIK